MAPSTEPKCGFRMLLCMPMDCTPDRLNIKLTGNTQNDNAFPLRNVCVPNLTRHATV